MARFTKSHFETVAHVLRTNLSKLAYDLKYSGYDDDDDDVDEIYATATARNAMYSVAVDFHNVFRLDNPRYDADKFMEACGIDDWRASITAKDYFWVCLPFLVGFLFGCITGSELFS